MKKIGQVLNRTYKKALIKRQVARYIKDNKLSALETYVLCVPQTKQTQPTPEMLTLAGQAFQNALAINLEAIAAHFPDEYADYIQIHPGEHYKFLAALLQILKPKKVMEIGTFTGASCLVMKKVLPAQSKLITYDVIPWDALSNTGLCQSDFDGQLEQRLMDLSDLKQSQTQVADLRTADFIFVDAAKDGSMEKRFCDFLDTVKFVKPPYVLFDDIRFLEMVKLWNEIQHPKLDLTSFAHWSGTGLVLWN
jgi:hypothetical protein